MSDSKRLYITRRTALKWGALAAAAPALGGLPLDEFVAQDRDSVAIRWNEAALQGVRDSKLGPPMVARALAIVHTCIYDAWAAYDHRAIGTRLGRALRRPSREHTLADMNAAISFAAYRAAVDLFPWDKTTVFDPLMATLGGQSHAPLPVIRRRTLWAGSAPSADPARSTGGFPYRAANPRT